MNLVGIGFFDTLLMTEVFNLLLVTRWSYCLDCCRSVFDELARCELEMDDELALRKTERQSER